MLVRYRILFSNPEFEFDPQFSIFVHMEEVCNYPNEPIVSPKRILRGTSLFRCAGCELRHGCTCQLAIDTVRSIRP